MLFAAPVLIIRNLSFCETNFDEVLSSWMKFSPKQMMTNYCCMKLDSANCFQASGLKFYTVNQGKNKAPMKRKPGLQCINT
jgi:hypothetical protein